MRCGVLLQQLRLFSACLGRYPPKTATFVLLVAWNAAAKISRLVLTLSSLKEGVAAACIATAPGVAAARVAAVAAAAAAGVSAARGSGGPQEAIRPSRWWSRIV